MFVQTPDQEQSAAQLVSVRQLTALYETTALEVSSIVINDKPEVAVTTTEDQANNGVSSQVPSRKYLSEKGSIRCGSKDPEESPKKRKPFYQLNCFKCSLYVFFLLILLGGITAVGCYWAIIKPNTLLKGERRVTNQTNRHFIHQQQYRNVSDDTTNVDLISAPNVTELLISSNSTNSFQQDDATSLFNITVAEPFGTTGYPSTTESEMTQPDPTIAAQTNSPNEMQNSEFENVVQPIDTTEFPITVELSTMLQITEPSPTMAVQVSTDSDNEIEDSEFENVTSELPTISEVEIIAKKYPESGAEILRRLEDIFGKIQNNVSEENTTYQNENTTHDNLSQQQGYTTTEAQDESATEQPDDIMDFKSNLVPEDKTEADDLQFLIPEKTLRDDSEVTNVLIPEDKLTENVLTEEVAALEDPATENQRNFTRAIVKDLTLLLSETQPEAQILNSSFEVVTTAVAQILSNSSFEVVTTAVAPKLNNSSFEVDTTAVAPKLNNSSFQVDATVVQNLTSIGNIIEEDTASEKPNITETEDLMDAFGLNSSTFSFDSDILQNTSMIQPNVTFVAQNITVENELLEEESHWLLRLLSLPGPLRFR